MTSPTFDALPEYVARKRRDGYATNFPLRKVVERSPYGEEETRNVLECGHVVIGPWITWAKRCRECGTINGQSEEKP